MAMGSRKLILRSPNMNTWSDCEVDDKISLNFIVNSGIFDLMERGHRILLLLSGPDGTEYGN